MGKDRPFNDVRYYLNFNKLLALGWKPEMSFKDGLKQTVEWYMSRDANWWECGTDSSLSAHQLSTQLSTAAASSQGPSGMQGRRASLPSTSRPPCRSTLTVHLVYFRTIVQSSVIESVSLVVALLSFFT